MALAACQKTGLVALAVLVSVATVADAQQAPNWQWCANEDNKVSPDLAINGCTAVIQSGKESQKNLAIAFYDRGVAFESKKDHDRAIADYNQALELNPGYAIAYVARGNAWSNKGDLDRALADYDKAIGLDPKAEAPYNNRARVWRGKGDLDQAIADLTIAIRLDPTDAYPYRERGLIEFATGDLAAAAADMLRSSERRDSAYTMAYRFLVRARLGEDGAAELATNAARLNTAEWPYAVIALLLGERTADDTLAAASTPGERCEASFYVGEWYLARDNRDKARPLLQNAADTCPKSFGEYFMAVAELKRLGP
jgi:tetratricopeptide (TPR) repeat protein